MDEYKNFATSTIATAPSPATSGLSFVVASGEGARFPAGPHNLVLYPSGQTPTSANAEIVRVTSRSSDTFTLAARAQEGTTAKSVAIGWVVNQDVTVLTLTDLARIRASGAYSIPYTVAAPADLSPTSGQIVFNNPSAITRVSVHSTGSDSTNWLTALTSIAGADPVEGTLRIVDYDNPAAYKTFDVLSVAPPASWGEENPASTPSARSGAAMVYDAANGEVVLFGGETSSGFSDETWTWNGANWTLENPANEPSARAYHVMFYDTVRGEVVLFGGNDGSADAETWTWNGTNWNNEAPANSPPATYNAAAAFDIGNSVGVLFGGTSFNTSTWKWNGTTWTEAAVAAPDPTILFGMAYDDTRDEIVLVGYSAVGNPMETWTWNGTAWTEESPATSPTSVDGQICAWNPARGTVMMFGGDRRFSPYSSETWEWNGTTWAELTSLNEPPPRFLAAMTYDTAHDRLLLFGGSNGAYSPGVYGDTWSFAPPDTTDLAVTQTATSGSLPTTTEVIFAYERAGELGNTGGAGGGIAIPYVFDDVTTNSDPGPGNLRLSTADQSLATTIRVDNSDSTGKTVTGVLASLDDSTSTIKGHIRLFKTDDPQYWILWTITVASAQSGYYNLTVSPVDSSSPADDVVFLDGEAVTLAFTRTGDAGVAILPNTMSSNSTAQGVTWSKTAGETLAFGDAVFLKSDGKVWKADANVASSYPCVGLAVSAAAADATVSVMPFGVVRLDSWTWTIGGLVYLSTTAGGLTQTAPSATDDVVQVVGVAHPNADTLFVNPQLTYITRT